MSDATATWRLEIGIVRPSEARLERLAEWYSAERDLLLRFAYVITRDQASAEDLVQDAFVRMYRAGARLEEAGFRAYARRTILNLATTGFRRRALDRRVMPEPSTAPSHADVVGTGVDMRRALLRISMADRACLALRYYEDLDDTAIADALGVSPAAAKKRIQRALGRLRAELEL